MEGENLLGKSSIRSIGFSAIQRFPSLSNIERLIRPRAKVFAEAYRTQAWGSAESGSGQGSELGATAGLREYLPALCRRLGVKSLLDAPCGDWNWMHHVDLSGIDYSGVDVVQNVVASNQSKYQKSTVRFMQADLIRDTLPRADLVLCRDCWAHLSFQDIASILENFRRTGATWLLVSNSPNVAENKNKPTGLHWRYLNLERPPFNFPVPIESHKDHYDDVDFRITLWPFAALPQIKLTP